ncbi:5-oxoprolinase subunit B family protein [Coraliomargarita parva]|uniref:5-oxoprolinase subunit B family protein n=1 Tax=Coraliomargarita parva TaxID=3014050 RepID=UPI0022B5D239|nr:allophanate hydrolase subunit 1 [Coraliomargarita parva]
MKFKLQSYGERGILVRELDEERRWRLIAAAEQCPPQGLAEYVPGYNTLLFYFKERYGFEHLEEWLGLHDVGSAGGGARLKGRSLRRIPVCYDGPDLEFVARVTGLRPEEVIQQHCTPVYTVRMIGFSPGFPYLEGLSPRLHLPRRDEPRNHIKPGSVAIGGPHAGIYSVASPGGWHLLGRTNVRLFDPGVACGSPATQAAACLLQAGDQVRFEVVEKLGDA